MSNSYQLQRRRKNLMKSHPFCYWCGKMLVYFRVEDGRLPDNFATIDHINSRLMYPDGRPKRGRQVLACPPCNQDRNNKEMRSLGKEELTRRAQGGHRHPAIEPLEESARAFRAEVNQLARPR